MQINPEDIIILKTKESELFAEEVYRNFAEELESRYRDRLGLHEIDIKTFYDGEFCPQIKANVRKKDAYVIHCFTHNGRYDPNAGFVKLLLINDALKRASAERIVNVLPYIPYMRQDRKDRPRVPISAKVIANHIQASHADRVLTADIHAGQEQGFFDIPLDSLPSTNLFINYLKKEEDYVVVVPDAGARERAEEFSAKLSCPTAYIGKKRDKESGDIKSLYLIGNVEGKTAIIPDDMIDTGGTLIGAYKLLRKNRAKDIIACATHGLFSPKNNKKAEDKLRETGMKVYVTNTIPRSEEYKAENADWLTILSMAPLFAKAIYRIHTGESLSELYK